MPRPAKKAHSTPELFRFLRQLELRFLRHRERYEAHVRDPILAFITDLGPRLAGIRRQIVADPRPVGGSMFRIHRDTRPTSSIATSRSFGRAAR